MLTWLTDPRLFNWLILGLFAINSVRWLWERNLVASAYWAGAFVCTIAATWDQMK